MAAAQAWWNAHYKAAAKHGIDVRYGARGTALLRGANGIKEYAPRSMACPRNIPSAPWCSRAAASRPTANGVRAISGRAGTWRRCGAPVTTPETGSAWRSTSARNPTANGRAATPSPGSATPAISATSKRATAGYPPQLSFGIMVNAEGKRFRRRRRRLPQLHVCQVRPRRAAAARKYAWQMFDANMPLLRDEYKMRGVTKVRPTPWKSSSPMQE